jgi:hypothetical protein
MKQEFMLADLVQDAESGGYILLLEQLKNFVNIQDVAYYKLNVKGDSIQIKLYDINEKLIKVKRKK